MKNSKKYTIIEIILVFFAFLLPGYLSQGTKIDPSVFSSVYFNIMYLSVSIPQILLLGYIIFIRNTNEPVSEPVFRQFGIAGLKLSDIGKAAVVFLGILTVSLAISAAGMIPHLKETGLTRMMHWTVTKPGILPLVLVTCLTTGYREEFFFRSYLLTRFREIGVPAIPGVLFAALLFSAGHIYQGLFAGIGTFLIGSLLGVIFIKTKNLHIIAIGHGLYNFATLLFQSFGS